MEITRAQGGVISSDEAGNVSIRDIGAISRVDLENIVQVKSHRILRDEAGTIHEIEFMNGGTARLSYTTEGAIREFEGQNITINLTTDNIITLAPNLE